MNPILTIYRTHCYKFFFQEGRNSSSWWRKHPVFCTR